MTNRNRNNKKPKIIIAIAAIFIIAYVMYRVLAGGVFGTAQSEDIDFSSLYGPYDVVYVIDGDTIIAEIDGEHVKIRLIGIDSPESVSYDESQNTPEGELASDFAKSLLENNRVWLEYDIEETDQYGRTLAYVYTKQYGMINDYIVKNGYAEAVVFEPNDKYADRFAESMSEAQENSLGIWAK